MENNHKHQYEQDLKYVILTYYVACDCDYLAKFCVLGRRYIHLCHFQMVSSVLVLYALILVISFPKVQSKARNCFRKNFNRKFLVTAENFEARVSSKRPGLFRYWRSLLAVVKLPMNWYKGSSFNSSMAWIAGWRVASITGGGSAVSR